MLPPHEPLFLRPTIIVGQSGPDDYQVIWSEIPIGRILTQPGVPAGRPKWAWGVMFPHHPQLAWQRGIASDLEEAKQRFKLAWGAVHAKLTEADIEAARHQAADSKKRWKT